MDGSAAHAIIRTPGPGEVFPVINQEKLDRNLATYVRILTHALAARHPFVKAMRLDERLTFGRVKAWWPHISGWEAQEDQLLNQIKEAMHPKGVQQTMPDTMLRFIMSMGPLVPQVLQEPREYTMVASFDGARAREIQKGCIVPPSEKAPTLEHMAIRGPGIIVVSQPVSAVINRYADNLPLFYAGGPGIYGARNADNPFAANESDTFTGISWPEYLLLYPQFLQLYHSLFPGDPRINLTNYPEQTYELEEFDERQKELMETMAAAAVAARARATFKARENATKDTQTATRVRQERAFRAQKETTALAADAEGARNGMTRQKQENESGAPSAGRNIRAREAAIERAEESEEPARRNIAGGGVAEKVTATVAAAAAETEGPHRPETPGEVIVPTTLEARGIEESGAGPEVVAATGEAIQIEAARAAQGEGESAPGSFAAIDEGVTTVATTGAAAQPGASSQPETSEAAVTAGHQPGAEALPQAPGQSPEATVQQVEIAGQPAEAPAQAASEAIGQQPATEPEQQPQTVPAEGAQPPADEAAPGPQGPQEISTREPEPAPEQPHQPSDEPTRIIPEKDEVHDAIDRMQERDEENGRRERQAQNDTENREANRKERAAAREQLASDESDSERVQAAPLFDGSQTTVYGHTVVHGGGLHGMPQEAMLHHMMGNPAGGVLNPSSTSAAFVAAPAVAAATSPAGVTGLAAASKAAAPALHPVSASAALANPSGTSTTTTNLYGSTTAQAGKTGATLAAATAAPAARARRGRKTAPVSKTARGRKAKTANVETAAKKAAGKEATAAPSASLEKLTLDI